MLEGVSLPIELNENATGKGAYLTLIQVHFTHLPCPCTERKFFPSVLERAIKLLSLKIGTFSLHHGPSCSCSLTDACCCSLVGVDCTVCLSTQPVQMPTLQCVLSNTGSWMTPHWLGPCQMHGVL
jgi:hypothetical protein